MEDLFTSLVNKFCILRHFVRNKNKAPLFHVKQRGFESVILSLQVRTNEICSRVQSGEEFWSEARSESKGVAALR